jgi:nucleoid DNA-binding protein/anti-sigma regulatory factor (Ser/Thr protein kinase)
MGNKVNFVDFVSKSIGKPQEETLELLEHVSEEMIAELLKGSKINWQNIFSLEMVQKGARLRRNPSTNEPIMIPPQKALKFKVGKALQNRINTEITEKSVLVLTPNTDDFKDLAKALESDKIILQVITSAKDLKDKIKGFQNIISCIINFPCNSPDYDNLINIVKTNKSLPHITLIGLSAPDINPQKPKGLKIMCDTWIDQSISTEKLKEMILADMSRIEEERMFFKNRIKVRLPTDNAFIEYADLIMEKLVENTGFKADQRNEFISAIREAVMNGARHGNKYAKDKFLDVEYLIDKSKATFTIKDEGPGFDYEAHIKRSNRTPEEIISEKDNMSAATGAGLGIIVMKKCVDELNYTHPGNMLSLTKYFKAKSL